MVCPEMQQVSAFSRPQTVPAVPTTVPKSNPWILSSWRDLILYVGTPLLLVPMFALAQARWSAQDIYVFVAAFGATGHHLPGMIRAYGDRALFERFRWRFIFAPIFLLSVCLAFTWWDLKGIILVVFFWGVWHGMMQTYGFCRIYDAKMGSFASLTRRIDFATCAIWFATAVFLSPQRLAGTLDTYYASGGPFISPEFLRIGQQLLFASAIGVAVLFLGNFARMWTVGKRPNPVKLALLTTSIAFWWYCNNGVTNILAGIALFEVFHDVQYLSLVWIYNRNRVEKDRSIGGFMRFVFRRSGSLVGLYIGLVFAYGSLGYFKETQIETIKQFLTGLVAASGLLHFYYDGFIWKVREKTTREHLGLTGGSAAVANQFVPSWALHSLKWLVVFIVPLGALWVGQVRSKTSPVDCAASVVSDVPASAAAHVHFGLALQDSGHLDEASEQFRTALRIDPKVERAHYGLGYVFLTQSKWNEALAEMEQAVRDDPRNGEVHADYGYILEQLGRKDEAEAEFEKGTELIPKSGKAHYKFGVFLLSRGDLDRAIVQFKTALQHNVGQAEVHYHLGRAFYLKGDFEGARAQYEETARLDTKAPVHNSLGVVYMRLGQRSLAIEQFNEALRQHPDDADAAENLRFAQANQFSPPRKPSP
ncbi:MAG TPA: tetratricopeptide repeat protein [Chthoniobacterales bacterium]|nr:tetratricopeptide repeat protein [Chthoniobacterales bacterium]